MTPVSYLAQTFNKVIMERWHQMQQKNRLKNTNPLHLQLALNYLNTQAARVVKLEYEKQEKIKTTKPATDQKQEESALSPLASAVMVVLALTAIGLVFAYIATHPKVLIIILSVPIVIYIFFKLLEYFVSALGWLFERLERLIPFERFSTGRHKIAITAIFYIIAITHPIFLLSSFDKFSDISILIPGIFLVIALIIFESDKALAPVMGRSVWLYSINSSMVESERMTILTALSESSSDCSAATGDKSQETLPEDPDISSSSSTPLPAPPGITEIVMDDSDQETFKAVRSHLVSVRNYHRVVLWSLIIAFLTFFSVSIYKFIAPSTTIGDYIKAFGSAGVGGAIIWFGMRVLWANRISQLSLALFESHVQEVHSSLIEMPAEISAERRRSIRAQVWTGFRTGLNAIWLSENELLCQNENPTSTKHKAEPGA